MEARKVSLPSFTVVGFEVVTNLKELASGIGEQIITKLNVVEQQIINKKNPNRLLVQFYPDKPDFDPWVDRFRQLFGYEVTEVANLPEGAVVVTLPESLYVTCTHKGIESEIQESYDFLYGEWIPKNGYRTKCFDFEIWDERYRPLSEDNEIDIHVAIE
ncbi:MAG: AraC family transcriptional regulator [Herbinix sp.]|jgi:predicted transcriptional regulator YdeE|nr:AraC family transcriptional regulator [Herbinix sp.]